MIPVQLSQYDHWRGTGAITFLLFPPFLPLHFLLPLPSLYLFLALMGIGST